MTIRSPGQRATAARVPTRLPIVFQTLGGEMQHAPLILAELRGVRTRLVLDTGSDTHLLTDELADQLGLERVAADDGTDHGGIAVTSSTAADLAIAWRGLTVTLRDVVVVPSPPPFRGWGIGGIISPQYLQPGATAVIDLVDDELILLEGSDDEVVSFLQDRRPTFRMLRLARDAGHQTVVVQAAIHPFHEIPTMLNTGGRHTEFSSAAVPGLGGGVSQRLGGGISGADVMGSLVGPRMLVVGGAQVPVRSLAVRPDMPDPQGLVGMDVLRGTVVTCNGDVSRPVYWQLPAVRRGTYA